MNQCSILCLYLYIYLNPDPMEIFVFLFTSVIANVNSVNHNAGVVMASIFGLSMFLDVIQVKVSNPEVFCVLVEYVLWSTIPVAIVSLLLRGL